MRESDGACRISGVGVTRIIIEGDSIAAQAALVGQINDTSVTFGNTTAKTGWPKEVTELASQLKEAVEEHFAQTLFEEEYYDGVDSASDRGSWVPSGIVQPRLDSEGDEEEQL